MVDTPKSKICYDDYVKKIGKDTFGRKWEKGRCDHCGEKRKLITECDLPVENNYFNDHRRGRKY